MKVVLLVPKSSLSLPSRDPIAVAMEAALRFTSVRFERKVTDSERRVDVSDSSIGETLSIKTFDELVDLLARNSKDLNASVTSEKRPIALAIEKLCMGCLLPAFQYLALECNVPSYTSSSLWSLVDGGRNETRTTLSSVYSLQSSAQATSLAEKALVGLELLVTLPMNTVGGGTKFCLGNSEPTSADCLLFACVTALLHAKWTSPAVLLWQEGMKTRHHRLLQFTEVLRLLYFETYSGFFQLRPVPSDLLNSNADDATYRRGRSATVAVTALFASVYFVLVNAQVIVDVVRALSGGDEDEVDEGAVDDIVEPQVLPAVVKENPGIVR